MRGKGKKAAYTKELPRRMYTFFISYDDAQGAPSYEKFARSVGLCAEDIEAFRKHAEFERAYRECGEIRRDYLIDRALTRRFDASFTKFLLSEEDGCTEEEKSDSITVRIEVTE